MRALAFALVAAGVAGGCLGGLKPGEGKPVPPWPE
jgi:hypothetical protein